MRPLTPPVRFNPGNLPETLDPRSLPPRNGENVRAIHQAIVDRTTANGLATLRRLGMGKES